ncbi:hypothetical protein FXN61_43930 [Lentzea sp. PSKA42]|jgi:hypothetical protein|uniref:Uncharacterized protein n=1 Tax=Lentzea indica TaxID=2604800 RepID=A0ABX1FXS3_9PSEU|nr:hypothetical protein [Lentzea indica]NKE63307.1 hypothetical protein [Lentzea indica]
MDDQVVECPVRLTESNRDELRLLYADLRDHYARRDARDGTRTALRFVWSGVLDPELFGATYADQRHIFAASRPVLNSAHGADLPESLRHGVCTA